MRKWQNCSLPPLVGATVLGCKLLSSVFSLAVRYRLFLFRHPLALQRDSTAWSLFLSNAETDTHRFSDREQ